MNKYAVSSALIALLVLSGCSASSSTPVPPATPEATDPAAVDPASGGATPDQSKPGDTAPGGTESGAADPNPGDPSPTPTGPATPPQPAVTWKPSGIGYPLVPSDPSVEQKVAMLTFDDGPSEYTPAVLDHLAEANVKAVFFITGYGAERYPELVERIHEEGHVLGIHTMTHPNMTELTREKQAEEIQPLIELITEVTGESPKYFRPPFGAYDDGVLATLDELDLEAINWSNGSLDWDGVVDGYKDPNIVVGDVLEQLHPGSVILAHDTMKHTAEAVPLIIKALRAEDYEFVVLP